MENTLIYFGKNLQHILTKSEIKSLEGNTTNAPYRLFKWGYDEGLHQAKKDLEETKKGFKIDIVDIFSDYAKELKGLEWTISDLEEAPHHVSECQLYMIEKTLERISEEINDYIQKLKEPTPTTDQVQE